MADFSGIMADPMFHMGMGILGAGGNYGSFGKQLGQGSMAGILSYQNALQAQQKQQYLNLQMQQLQAQEAERQRQAELQEQRRAAQEQFISGLSPQQQALAQAFPEKFGQAYVTQQFKDPTKPTNPFMEVDGNLYNWQTGQWVTPPGGGQSPTGPWKDWNQMQSAGRQLNRDFIKDTAEERQVLSTHEIAGSLFDKYGSAEDWAGIDQAELVTMVAKAWDPTSVVRDSETVKLVNAQNLSNKLIGVIKRFETGGQLSPSDVKTLIGSMNRRAEKANKSYERKRNRTVSMAKNSQIPLNLVLPGERLPYSAIDVRTQLPDGNYEVVEEPFTGPFANPEGTIQR